MRSTRSQTAAAAAQAAAGHSQSSSEVDHTLSEQAQPHSDMQINENPIQRNSQTRFNVGRRYSTVEDALSYLDQVRYESRNDPQMYNDFLNILVQFRMQRLEFNTPDVIQRVYTLFRSRGYPQLIAGFNVFLPEGYKGKIQPNVQSSNPTQPVANSQSSSCGVRSSVGDDIAFSRVMNYVSKRAREKSMKRHEIKYELPENSLEDLVCSICTELFIRPAVLDCSHTFCEYCIKVWKETQNSCPICRHKIQNMIRVLTLEEFLISIHGILTPDQKARRDSIIATRYPEEHPPKPDPEPMDDTVIEPISLRPRSRR